MSTTPSLSIKGLRVSFNTGSGELEVLHGVSLDVHRGQRLGVVGESGSGKSITALAALGMLGRHGRVTSGAIWLGDTEITGIPPKSLREIRGRRIAMIFQDPMTALNPAITVGRQLVDVIRSHSTASTTAARGQAIDLLARVGIKEPSSRISAYPHQLSGGMRQRVMIALAIACQPEILMADEPTTALDVTVQAQIVDLLNELCDSLDLALIFISHNLDLVAELCDDIVVMNAGNVVESGAVEKIFSAPDHPYTLKLLNSIPRINQFQERTALT